VCCRNGEEGREEMKAENRERAEKWRRTTQENSFWTNEQLFRYPT